MRAAGAISNWNVSYFEKLLNVEMIVHVKRRAYYRQFFLVAALLLLLYVEETHYGLVRVFYNNYYKNEVYLPIEKERTVDIKLSIVVVVILGKLKHLEEYSFAQNTLECYCQHFDYPLLRISLDQHPELDEKCLHKDFFFKRHCVLTDLMKNNSKYDYFFVLDADIGVINPNHLLEDYINPNSDLVFYSRIFNWEFMAGSYIARNTKYAKQFLDDWAAYEYKVPNSYHGTDNAAIHQVILDRFVPSKKHVCQPFWEVSKDWDGVAKFVACTRLQMEGNLTFESVEFRPKYSNRTWSRDAHLTNSLWSPKDFMFHALKARTLDNVAVFATWYNPMIMDERFDLSKCSSQKAMENWIYKDTFIKNDQQVGAIIGKTIEAVNQDYEDAVKSLKLF